MAEFLAIRLIIKKESLGLIKVQEAYKKLFRKKKYSKYKEDVDAELIASGNDDIIVEL